MGPALIKLPSRARSGEAVEVRVLLQHIMETGFRRGDTGELIPRHIVTAFWCRYGGEDVIDVELHPAIAANPYFTFFLSARESGPVSFRWTDDRGAVHTETMLLEVA